MMTLKKRDKLIPKFKAVDCSSILLSLLVIEARAIALSAERISSKEIMTGSRGASSFHLSIPSNKGVSERRAAESIGSFQNKALKALSFNVSA